MREVLKLAGEGQLDYIVVEGSGIAEPQPIAEAFTAASKGSDGTATADLDTIVTVVDADRFLEDYLSMNQVTNVRGAGIERIRPWKPLSSPPISPPRTRTRAYAHTRLRAHARRTRHRRVRTTQAVGKRKDLVEVEGADKHDTRQIVRLLVDQVEGANVVVMNKIDLVSSQQRIQLEGILRSLNPMARLLPCSYGRVDLDRVLGTGLFSESQVHRTVHAWYGTRRGVVWCGVVWCGVTLYTFHSPTHPALPYSTVSPSIPTAVLTQDIDSVAEVGSLLGATNRAYADTVSGSASIASFIYERRDRPMHPQRLHELVCGWHQVTLCWLKRVQMAWCGVAWFDVQWCSLVWRSTKLCGTWYVVWCGVVW